MYLFPFGRASLKTLGHDNFCRITKKQTGHRTTGIRLNECCSFIFIFLALFASRNGNFREFSFKQPAHFLSDDAVHYSFFPENFNNKRVNNYDRRQHFGSLVLERLAEIFGRQSETQNTFRVDSGSEFIRSPNYGPSKNITHNFIQTTLNHIYMRELRMTPTIRLRQFVMIVRLLLRGIYCRSIDWGRCA